MALAVLTRQSIRAQISCRASPQAPAVDLGRASTGDIGFVMTNAGSQHHGCGEGGRGGEQGRGDGGRRQTRAGHLTARDHRRLRRMNTPNPPKWGLGAPCRARNAPSHNRRTSEKCDKRPRRDQPRRRGEEFRCPTRSSRFRPTGRSAPSSTRRNIDDMYARSIRGPGTGSGPSRPSASTGSSRSPR